MNMGAERAEAQPQDGTGDAIAKDWIGTAPQIEIGESAPEPEERGSGARKALAALLIVLALAWLGAVGWVVSRSGQADPAALLWAGAMASGPLILLGLLWLMFGRTQRRETERFTAAVAEMRRESAALENILAIVAARLEDNQQKLTGEAARLMSLGDEASDRLGRVTHYLARETAVLGRKSEQLESAAANARVDIGVLLSDLPRAEGQARAVSDAMKEAGMAALQRAESLEAQLSALLARGREADEVAGGAAQRLAAHLARIESTSGTASARMNEASTAMVAAVDASMARADEAIDAARKALDAQGAATLATIEQSRAALDRTGEDSARALRERLDVIGTSLETLAGKLAGQDEASRTLMARLADQLADVEARLASLGASGEASTGRLAEAVQAVRSSAGELAEALDGDHARADALIGRTGDLSEALAAIGGQLDDTLPAALARVEEQAQRTRQATTGLVPQIEAVHAAAGEAASRLAEAEASVAWQREQLERGNRELVGALTAQLGEVETRYAALRDSGAAVGDELGAAIERLHGATGALDTALAAGGGRSADLLERSAALSDALGAIGRRLDEELPQALAAVEAGIDRSRAAAAGAAPDVDALRSSAEATAARLDESEASVGRQREALDAMLARASAGLEETEAQLRALGSAVAEADAAAGKLAGGTAPELVEALVRVRETANQAAAHAREAIAAVIPQSAAALANAGREAVTRVVGETVEAQMRDVSAIADHAVETARKASERLTRQLLTIGETAAAIEARIDETRREREEKEAEGLSRRVSLLIESLHSTAIDVTKILSNEVTDSAWQAYMKGDRGVFTRRAVRLLDNVEAREILAHYENEPEFREQVNRYIHDFEGMLSRVLADPDGSPLGVTILSSDMGKLYVALAQAIERLRK